MTQLLHIFGAGGHGRELAWLARDVHGEDLDLVFLVDDESHLSGPVHGHPVRLLADVTRGGLYVAAIGDPAIRERAARACETAGLVATTLIHPRVEHSPDRVRFGPGSVVAAGSVLTTDIALGRHVHVNVGCTVSHDAVLEDYVTLSPGVHIAGHVTVERGAFLGTGVTVINGTATERLVIGAGAVVAAGAVVTGSVAPGALVAGVPAVQKR
ncbi:acetyltransferase [Nocardioides sp. WS12]|uniref:acetyltransferase n=1 Tax=Nocardioides sp. WS12 TaxID=2486272 RepID=UPI0015FE669B|nr:acetyltransferase [Nocardioides sp. WS12]